MRSISRKTLFAAMFVFAAGFASAGPYRPVCPECDLIFEACLQRPGMDQWSCAPEYNACAGPSGCRQKPE